MKLSDKRYCVSEKEWEETQGNVIFEEDVKKSLKDFEDDIAKFCGGEK